MLAETKVLVDSRRMAEIPSAKPGTIRLWAREKRIPSIRVGGKFLRFDPEAVLKALEEQQG